MSAIGSREWWLALAKEQADRFWRKVDKSGTCWIWTAGRCKDGYGKYAITAPSGFLPKQLHVRAHRLSYELVHGPADPGLVTIHSCDTPGCVNPDHLRLGTQRENRDDCARKNRNATGDRNGRRVHPASAPRGSRHPNATINEATASEIKRLHARGVRQAEIARQTSVSAKIVHQVVSGHTWRHVA